MPTIEEIPDLPPFVSQVAGPQAKYTDHDKFVEDLMKTPLFMKTMPTEKDIEENETLAAIHSLIYDGTPEEIATNFKNQGNEAFQAGPREFKHAINYYTKGLEQKADSPKLNAILYANRAAVNLELGNYRKVLNDCGAAITLQPDFVKAYYRSIKALLALDKLEEALDCCERALKIDPHNAAISIEQAKVLKRKTLKEETARAQLERERQKEADERMLQNAIKARGIKMISSDPKSSSQSSQSHYVHASQGTHAPHLDKTTTPPTLCVPIVLLYPEYSQSDLIAAARETDPLQHHLDTIFEEAAPWDTQGTYKPDNLDVYFESQSTADKPPRLLRVGSHLPLATLLQHNDYAIVDGVATLFVMARSSPFAKAFRKRYTAPKAP
ncbi:hypothetical protein DFJ77DRAFT_484370 [Powellomyces hirtus]|nr:hypothetical protein DFJ77DRAFT_484370 [Powellomyces hirtus]